MSSRPVVKVPFLSCAVTAYTDDTPVLEVTRFAEFLRGPDGTCAFCHADLLAARACQECRGGFIRILTTLVRPLPYLPVRTFTGCGWSFQHVPHGSKCRNVTWIDREFAAHPDHYPFETCPCCQGRPT